MIVIGGAGALQKPECEQADDDRKVLRVACQFLRGRGVEAPRGTFLIQKTLLRTFVDYQLEMVRNTVTITENWRVKLTV